MNPITKKISILLINCIFLTCLAKSQAYNLPSLQYIPQTPEAEAYSRYGEIPVGYSTGVPEIEIPIYSLHFGEIDVPINISYHASGIKVNDVATEVGLGWVLNYGSVLNVNILGVSDVWGEYRPVEYRTSDDIADIISNTPHNSTGYLETEKIWKDVSVLYPTIDYYTPSGAYYIDFFSDRYNYSLVTGESGVFRRDYVNDSIRLLPYQPVKVDKFDSSGIDIISANGYTHCFKFNAGGYLGLIYLDKIISSDKVDTITYQYIWGQTDIDRIGYSMSWQSYEPFHSSQSCSRGIRYNPKSTCEIKYMGQAPGEQLTPLVTKILTRNTEIDFQYSTGRNDFVGTDYKLHKVYIKNRHDQTIYKEIEFKHSYFGTSASDNERLRLDSVYFKGSSDNTIQKYSFAYNGMTLPKYPRIEQGERQCYEDYWGYNNNSGGTQIPQFFTSFNIPDFECSYGNREPDTNFVQACILTQINYPTGGKTKFAYEPNKTYLNTILGGVRIKKITSYSSDENKAFTKTYSYSVARYGNIIYHNNFVRYNLLHHVYFPRYEYFVSKDEFVCLEKSEEYYQTIASSESFVPLTHVCGTPIIYDTVTEITGEGTDILGKNVYIYDNSKWTETINDMLNECPNSEEIDQNLMPRFHNDYGNYKPKLTNIKTYKYTEGTFSLVKEVTNQYTDYKIKEFNAGLLLATDIVFETFGEANALGAFADYNITPSQVYENNFLNDLFYCDSKGHENNTMLTSTTETDYTRGISLATTYDYDNNTRHMQPVYITKTTSTGISEDSIRYPEDVDLISGLTSPQITAINDLITDHRLNLAIEKKTFEDGTLINTMLTPYKNFGGERYYPEKILAAKGEDPLETRINYFNYDNYGNVLSTSKEGDIPIGYYWDYNKTYPVIKAINVSGGQLSLMIDAYDEIFPNGVESFDQITEPSLNTTQNTWLKQIHENLCSHFSNSMIYVYTYKPLVGMTSETDPNGITTYYEYDSFGRLQYIKDQDLIIVKEYKYHYKE